MTETELADIERMVNGGRATSATECIEAIRLLVAEVRRCGGPWERIETGARAWDEMQRNKR
jgi:hypothetical protein